MASRILGRRAATGADFTEAFTLERIDLIAEVNDDEALLRLGRNVSGPRDGLYIIAEEPGYRVYVQERGIPLREQGGLDFEAAREAAIDLVVMMNGIPFII